MAVPNAKSLCNPSFLGANWLQQPSNENIGMYDTQSHNVYRTARKHFVKVSLYFEYQEINEEINEEIRNLSEGKSK